MNGEQWQDCLLIYVTILVSWWVLVVVRYQTECRGYRNTRSMFKFFAVGTLWPIVLAGAMVLGFYYLAQDIWSFLTSDETKQ